jgi:hypothetical protein
VRRFTLVTVIVLFLLIGIAAIVQVLQVVTR